MVDHNAGNPKHGTINLGFNHFLRIHAQGMNPHRSHSKIDADFFLPPGVQADRAG